MNYYKLILLNFSLLLLTSVFAFGQSPLWVSGYYPGWQQGYHNTGYLKAEDIDYSALTHVIHFSLEPNPNGSYDSVSLGIDEVNSATVLAAAHAAGKKVLICIGGASTAVGFRGATNSSNRTKFVNALAGFVSRRGYDGIDIDWEPLEQSDSTQFVEFVTALRSKLDLISPRPLMTAAVGSMPTVYAQVQSSFDQINVMTYDMSGAYGGWVTWHNSPLNNGGYRFASTGGLIPSAHDELETFTATGIPAGKLGLGIGFYGYEWRGGTGTTTGGVTAPRQSWTAAPSVGQRYYYEIMDSFYQPSYARWDSIAMVPYLSIDNAGSANDRFISYDDERSSAKKIEFAKTQGMGGIIIWELGSGYRANQSAGQRDLLLQAVKSSMQSTNIQPTPNYPFPQHHPYTTGAIKPTNISQSGLDDAVRTFYDQWKARYLVAGCDSGEYFVFYNYEGGTTPADAICVSEGQGYGMLITAFMAGHDANAKIFFDGLYKYYRAHQSSVNARLMAWRQEAGCVEGLDDMDSATDGDLDIAYALLLADKQWGSAGAINYLSEAYSIIDAIMQDEINRDRYSVKLGDWSNASDPTFYNATRSSDFMTDHFRVFESITGDSRWNSIINSCYNYISTIQTNNSSTTGLLPDFIKNVNTTPVPAQANFLESANDGQYYYNACRDPWRITTDYLLSGESRAKVAIQKINTWIKTKTGSNPTNLRAGYTLTGNAIHNDYVDLPFIAPLMVGAMADSSNQSWLNALWSQVVGITLADDGYYGNSIKMLSMIVASGNWWVPSGERTVSFSGYQWSVKNSGTEVWGPGPNYFSDALSNVWVDSLNHLHVRITHRDNKWQCAEVTLDHSLGYGQYVFHVQGNVGTLDVNSVLGLFTWDDDSTQAHREMDIEFSRWGYAADPTNAQFVSQPYDTPGNLTRWTIPETMSVSTNSFNWRADSIGFISVGGDHNFPPYSLVNASWRYTGVNLPTPGNERVHINLWLNSGDAPSDTNEIEVIITKFEFDPTPPAPSQPTLNSPANASTVNTQPVSMQWQRSDNAESYQLQVSTSSGFGTTVVNDSTITDTVSSVNILVSGTTYYWRVRAKNSGGVSAWSAVRSFTFISQTKWKLVSVPMDVVDGRKNVLFPTAISNAYTFTSSGYAQRDSLTPGVGYWLKFGNDTTSNIAGDTLHADTISVVAGWNLIGSITLPVDVSTIVTDPPNIIQSSFFGYENGYSSSLMIMPGRGYWVRVSQGGVIVLR